MVDNLDEVFAEPMEAAAGPVQEPEAKAEPTPETVEAKPEIPDRPEVAEQPEAARPGYVPLDAMLTEREKRQAAERRIAEIEAQRKPQDIPDAFDDPQGFAAYQDGKLQQALFQERFATSEYLATEKYGKDDVKAAADWAVEQGKTDPTFAQRFAAERFPMMWIVQQHKRDAMLSDIGDNPDDWFNREAAKRGYVAQNAPAQAAPVAAVPQQATAPVRVPRSLATQGSGPSDIRQTATGALAGVDALFN